MFHNAFATAEENEINNFWELGSPVQYVKKGSVLPAFFIATRGANIRTASSQSFCDLILSTGNDAQIVNAKNSYNHNEINWAIGNSNDTIVTPELSIFLQTFIFIP